MTPLSGPGSRRQLTSEAGAYAREARRLERQGYRNEAGKLRALESQSRLLQQKEGIASAESRMAEQEYGQRMQAGMAEIGRRSLLGQGQVGVGQPVTDARSSGVQGATRVEGAIGVQGAGRTGTTRVAGTMDQEAAAPADTAAPAAGMATAGTAMTASAVPSLLARPATAKGMGGQQTGLPRTKESLLQQAFAEASKEGSGTREQIVNRLNEERYAQGMPKFKVSDEDYANLAKSQQQIKEYNVRSEAGRQFDTQQAMSRMQGPSRAMMGQQSNKTATDRERADVMQRAQQQGPPVIPQQSGPPRAAATPRPQAPLLVQRTNQAAQNLSNTLQAPLRKTYSQRRNEDFISGQQMVDAATGAVQSFGGGLRALPSRARSMAERTNAWSERTSQNLRRNLGIQ